MSSQEGGMTTNCDGYSFNQVGHVAIELGGCDGVGNTLHFS